jgi:hypothetical protein
MSALIWQLLASSTKGIEYIIAIIGLGSFLLFLKWLKTPEERPQKAVLDRGTRIGPALRNLPYAIQNRWIMRPGVGGVKEAVRARFRR